MAQVHFDVRHEFETPSEQVWGELVDWEGHAAWIPMTRMEVEPGEPTAPGARFTAYTGLGPLALEDRMEVVDCEWDEAAASGSCTVAKLGPVLRGRAWFTVSPKDDSQSVVDWNEDVTVPYTPQFLAPVVARFGAFGFKMGMRRLAKQL
ncbi:MAG: SRPBCC family protein [Ilumatobacter sp.]|nr:SRPBCC family protein [Ilumatobacter sp.]